jgi:hypothetical protein
MSFVWSDLIARAKTYADDDHSADRSWLSDDKWMSLLQTEYGVLYRRWVRLGVCAPSISETDFSNTYTVGLSGVLAIVGVAEDMGQYIRILRNAKAAQGHQAIWRGSSEPNNTALEWAATGMGSAVTVELHPRPTSGNFIVRFIPEPARATDPTTNIDLPSGADERLVLGAVRRANLKDSTASAGLERLIQLADEDLAMTASARSDGPLVKRVQRRVLLRTPLVPVAWPGPSEWQYI